jgi:hypothetical protein
MKRTYSQIDMDERRKLARWRVAGISVDVMLRNCTAIALAKTIPL